jgi:peptidoglycan/LPS O-acetylase OafA/YrhL
MVVGIVFILNPNVVSDFSSWVERMTNEKILSRPPQVLITSAALFFGLIGLSDFFMAGTRLAVFKVKRRVLADILSGVALLLFSYLIYLYGNRALTWQAVLATEVVAAGLLIVLYSVLRHLFLKKNE